jgi:2-(1,2-epoxy-1,2-dihydrophenyl)acetyl-CoA isomerase
VVTARPVRLERDDDVLVIELHRPDVLNALDDALLDALLSAWAEAAAPDVRAVVLAGAGRAFCAGADLRQPARPPAEIVANQRRRYSAQALAMVGLAKPIVAAVHGAAVGAGLALACAADVRIASDRAMFLPGFAGIGAVPDAGASWTVPRLIGHARAFDWFASSKRLGATEALAWGLVNEVVPADQVQIRARQRAAELAACPGSGLARTKGLLTDVEALAAQLAAEERAQGIAAADPARTEARRAVAGR